MSSSSSEPQDCLADTPVGPAPPELFAQTPSHSSFDTTVILVGTLLGLMNLAIHLSWFSQFRGLVGKNGISPIVDKLKSRAAQSTMKGLFKPNGFVFPSDNNMKSIILVGAFFGAVQAIVGLLQLCFGCRRNFLSHSSPSICVETIFIRDFILGSNIKYSFSSVVSYCTAVANTTSLNNILFLLVKYIFSTITSTLTTSWFCSLVSFVTYSSLRETADRFMGLQMHAKVLELNFWFAILSFCGNSFATAFAFQFFAFRLMFGGGLGKLTGSDFSWSPQSKTAMCYHYWTMPLPNPLSRFFHHLPLFVHHLEIYVTYVVEGPLGFASLFQPLFNEQFLHVLRVLAFLGNAMLLFGINISGNFGHLWLASIAASSASLDDAHLSWIFPLPLLSSGDNEIDDRNNYINNGENSSSNNNLVSSIQFFTVSLLWLAGIAVSFFYCTIQLIPLADTYRSNLPPPFHYPIEKVLLPLILENTLSIQIRNSFIWRKMWDSIEQYAERFSSLHVLNMYVKFANMTKFRHEIIVQVKSKETGSPWVDVPFLYKPVHEDDTPRFAPICHMPSLDWQLWFLPLGFARGTTSVPVWFDNFLSKIKQQEQCVLDLLDREKIEKMRKEGTWSFSSGDQGEKPVCVRAMIYEFIYSTISDLDEGTGVANGGQIGITKKMEGYYQRVGKPKVGKWWRKTQIGHQSVWEV